MNRTRVSYNTPVRLEVLLRTYYSAEPVRPGPPAKEEALKRLQAEGAVEADPERPGCVRCTEKGRAWVEAILSVPPPVATTVWVIPDDPGSARV